MCLLAILARSYSCIQPQIETTTAYMVSLEVKGPSAFRAWNCYRPLAGCCCAFLGLATIKLPLACFYTRVAAWLKVWMNSGGVRNQVAYSKAWRDQGTWSWAVGRHISYKWHASSFILVTTPGRNSWPSEAYSCKPPCGNSGALRNSRVSAIAIEDLLALGKEVKVEAPGYLAQTF